MTYMAGTMQNAGGYSHSMMTEAVIKGDAYRVSTRHTMSDLEELIVHFDPAGTDPDQVLYIATPAIDTPENARVDVYENADPGASVNSDLEIHNMRYDVPASMETPQASITRVTDGGLDLTNAEKTEETQIQSQGEYQTPGDLAQRGIWRIISGTETVSMIITDESGGVDNRYAFDTVVYEGPSLPED